MRNLNLIFYRDGCIEGLLGFQREDIFRNTSLVLSRNEEEAVDYYMEICTNLENDYAEMRRNIPDAFGEIQQFIEDIETDKLCEIVFEGDPMVIGLC